MKLTAKEVDTLRLPVERAGEVVSRETLLKEVWEYREGVVSRTLDTTIYTLRQKIEPTEGNPVHLLTVRGKGGRTLARMDRLDEAAGLLVEAAEQAVRPMDTAQVLTLRGEFHRARTASPRAGPPGPRPLPPGGLPGPVPRAGQYPAGGLDPARPGRSLPFPGS